MGHAKRTVVLCLILAGIVVLAPAQQPDLLTRAATHVMVVAHRGGGFFAPEDTLAAIDLGLEVGVDGVELDVWKTADGHYVLMHDNTVDRTTNGTGEIASLTLAQIRALEVRWTPEPFVRRSQFPVPPDSDRFRHLRVPTLEEALGRVHAKAFAMLDLKAEDVEGVARLVVEKGLVGDVIFKVNSVAEGEAVRRVAPDAVLLGRPDDEQALDEMLRALRPPIMHLDDKTLKAEIIRRLDQAGTLVWMNTLGQTDVTALASDTDGLSWLRRLSDELGKWWPAQAQPGLRPYRKLAERGADFIQTDNLVTVVQAMSEFRKPAPRPK